MDRMLYVAMAGAKQTLQAQGIAAHNLANVSTTGFRADLAAFNAQPVQGAGFATRVNVVSRGEGFDLSSGSLSDTGRDLDVGVKGPGWIAVQAADGGEAYTRAACWSTLAGACCESSEWRCRNDRLCRYIGRVPSSRSHRRRGGRQQRNRKRRNHRGNTAGRAQPFPAASRQEFTGERRRVAAGHALDVAGHPGTGVACCVRLRFGGAFRVDFRGNFRGDFGFQGAADDADLGGRRRVLVFRLRRHDGEAFRLLERYAIANDGCAGRGRGDRRGCVGFATDCGGRFAERCCNGANLGASIGAHCGGGGVFACQSR